MVVVQRRFEFLTFWLPVQLLLVLLLRPKAFVLPIPIGGTLPLRFGRHLLRWRR